MNEETDVLNFFAREENLSLCLAVAEQADALRVQMNSRFWLSLQTRINSLPADSVWHAQVIQDRNSAEVLVGLQCRPRQTQVPCLFPMLEQQYLCGQWRIFFGLMWGTAPTPDQLALPAVARLKQTLLDSGFKSNDGFLGWQWSMLHPRRSDFLLKLARQPEALLGDVDTLLSPLLQEHSALIGEANTALAHSPRNASVSPVHLHKKTSSN